MTLNEPSWLDKLSTRELVLLIITVMVVIGVGYYQLEFAPLMEKRERIDARTREVKTNIESFQLVLNRSSAEKLADRKSVV